MSYTPTVWANGDTITAQKLNKMENGIADAGGGGGTGAVIVNDVEGTLDATWQEIWDAAEAGPVIISIVSATEIDHYPVETVLFDTSDPNDPYYAVRTDTNGYSTTASSGYPTLES